MKDDILGYFVGPILGIVMFIGISSCTDRFVKEAVEVGKRERQQQVEDQKQIIREVLNEKTNSYSGPS